MLTYWEILGGPEVMTQCFHYKGPGSIPGRGTKIPQEKLCNHKKKTKKKPKKNRPVKVVLQKGFVLTSSSLTITIFFV